MTCADNELVCLVRTQLFTDRRDTVAIPLKAVCNIPPLPNTITATNYHTKVYPIDKITYILYYLMYINKSCTEQYHKVINITETNSRLKTTHVTAAALKRIVLKVC